MLLFTLGFGVQAQGIKLDSLLHNLIRADQQKLEYTDALLDIGNYYVYQNLDSASYYVNSAIDHLNSNLLLDEVPNEYYRHWLLKSWVFHGNQNLDSALFYIDKAEPIVTKYGTDAQKLEIRINKGAILSHLNDDRAKDYAKHLIEISDTSLSNYQKMQWVLGQDYLSEYHRLRYQYTIALDSLLAVLRSGILKDIPDYQIGVTRHLSMLADAIGDTDIAIKTLTELLNTNILNDHRRNDVMINLAEVYFRADSIILASKILNDISERPALNNAHKLNLAEMNSAIALQKRNYSQAKLHLSGLDSLCEITNYNISKIRVAKGWIKYHKAVGNRSQLVATIKDAKLLEKLSLEDSIFFKKEYLLSTLNKKSTDLMIDLWSMIDTLQNRKSLELTKRNLIAFETEKKELENNILQSDLFATQLKANTDQRRLWFVLALLVLSLLLAVLIWRNLKQQKTIAKLLEAENQDLVFEKDELQALNRKLENQLNAKVSANYVQIIKIKSRDKVLLLKTDEILYV